MKVMDDETSERQNRVISDSASANCVSKYLSLLPYNPYGD